MTDDLDRPVFRIAMRVEGSQWVAYLAKVGTMENAMWLGAIRFDLARNPAVKQAFIDLMKIAMNDALKTMGATVTGWNEESAPEHERSGHG